ncbi:hypothetical protein D3C87_81910 [compost metagenome]
MSNLLNLSKFINYVLEKHPDLAETDFAADHEIIYLAMPDSDEEVKHLIKKGEELGLVISEEQDSLSILC